MKRSELKWYQLEALVVFEDENSDNVATGPLTKAGQVLLEFGREIAEQLEPELEPVDISVLVYSSIDCVFGMHEGGYNNVIGELGSINIHGKYGCGGWPWFDTCKPRTNYWFSAKNFEHIGVHTLIKQLIDGGFNVKCEKEITPFDFDVVKAFMITGPQEGRCYPWEINND